MIDGWQEPDEYFATDVPTPPSPLNVSQERIKRLEAVIKVVRETVARCRYDGYVLRTLEDALADLDNADKASTNNDLMAL